MAHRRHCTKLQLRATRKLSVDKFEPLHRVSGSSCNQIVGGRVEVDRDPVAGDGADVAQLLQILMNCRNYCSSSDIGF